MSNTVHSNQDKEFQMKKRIITIFSGLCLTLFGFINISQAQTMNHEKSLSTKQAAIISIAAYTATGKLDQLQTALNEGLDAGLTVNEIKEILVQMYAYTGFPRSLNGINTFSTVLENRQQKGIHDEVGEEAKPIPTDRSKYEIGKENLSLLTGVQPPAQPSGYAAFVPTIEIFLKEHLFADIFERGVLDFQTREIVTIAALASMGNVNDQLRSHLNVGIYNGLDESQLRSLFAIIGSAVGAQEAENANEVLSQILRSR